MDWAVILSPTPTPAMKEPRGAFSERAYESAMIFYPCAKTVSWNALFLCVENKKNNHHENLTQHLLHSFPERKRCYGIRVNHRKLDWDLRQW